MSTRRCAWIGIKGVIVFFSTRGRYFRVYWQACFVPVPAPSRMLSCLVDH
jgi:hypothetical protein